MSVKKITTDNFENEVLKAGGKVLLDFWAEWCGPCRMLSPIIDELSDELKDVKFGKVNVDEEPQLAGMFGIESIPTLIVFTDGKVSAKSVGVVPKNTIVTLLNSK